MCVLSVKILRLYWNPFKSHVTETHNLIWWRKWLVKISKKFCFLNEIEFWQYVYVMMKTCDFEKKLQVMIVKEKLKWQNFLTSIFLMGYATPF